MPQILALSKHYYDFTSADQLYFLFEVFGICTESAPFLMIVEYLPKGNLRDYLINHGESKTTFGQLVSMCENVS